MPQRTKFRNHKSFSSQKDAQNFLEKLQAANPNIVYNIKKREFPGKIKVRFMVRSIVKRGSK
jgi:hypothetical protein